MKRIILLAAVITSLLLPATAFAFNPLADACSKDTGGTDGGASSSAVCSADGKDPITGTSGVLEKVTLILATVAAITAVIIIIVAGFQMVTAGGDAQKIASARTSIIGAVTGLVIIAAAASIITFVVSKL